jgi:hypothetical protein
MDLKDLRSHGLLKMLVININLSTFINFLNGLDNIESTRFNITSIV